jgi:hypothetical protein
LVSLASLAHLAAATNGHIRRTQERSEPVPQGEGDPMGLEQRREDSTMTCRIELVSYISLAAAIRASLLRSWRNAQLPQRPYKCGECGAYHLTTRPMGEDKDQW